MSCLRRSFFSVPSTTIRTTTTVATSRALRMTKYKTIKQVSNRMVDENHNMLNILVSFTLYNSCLGCYWLLNASCSSRPTRMTKYKTIQQVSNRMVDDNHMLNILCFK
uniref:Uncharacterized protein n=1 Tax=Cacopsylla melanoneura TaxID=428564 RepID=A0A8D9BLC1_9HEMI